MGKIKSNEEKAIPKTITIFSRHQRYIEENSLNLSKFVQKKIDEVIAPKNITEPNKVSEAKTFKNDEVLDFETFEIPKQKERIQIRQ